MSQHSSQPSQNSEQTFDQVEDPVRRRPHSMLSPLNSPNKGERSPAPKRFHGRARTGIEFKVQVSTSTGPTNTYNFQHNSYAVSTTDVLSPSIETFRPLPSEVASVNKFLTHTNTYCLLKNGLMTHTPENRLVGIQPFLSISQKQPCPEIASIAYVQ